ncbi:MAG: hypothetical protein J6U88_01675 [Bacteroidales bacterium]|nr:hypothetical protein [Bacteroidales bacterium]
MITKFIKSALIMAALFFLCFSFVSCSKVGGGSKLSGYYSTTPQEGWEGYDFRRVYHFINSNTVVYYEYVANGRYWDFSEQLKSGWYIQEGCGKHYTYTISENKVFITNGKILTIENDGESLMPDGESSWSRFTKWE